MCCSEAVEGSCVDKLSGCEVQCLLGDCVTERKQLCLRAVMRFLCSDLTFLAPAFDWRAQEVKCGRGACFGRAS